MRVLMVSECPWAPTSMGKVTLWLVQGLKELGFDVKVVCFAGVATMFGRGLRFRAAHSCCDWARNVLEKYVEVEVYPWCGNLAQHLYDIGGADIVLLYGTPYAPPLSEILPQCREIGVPCLGYFLNESLTLPPEYALHVLNVHGFAAPTEFVRRTIIDGCVHAGFRRDVFEERTFVVYHGIDHDLYRPEVCSELGRLFPPELFIVGTLGKNMIRKNLFALLMAVATLPEHLRERIGVAAMLIQYGAGDPKWNIEATLSLVEMKTGWRMVRERTFFTSEPFTSMGLTEREVLQIYCSVDLFAFPSDGEAFGLPPLEAAAVGKPIVVSAHPALAEVWGEALPEDAIVPCEPYVVPEGLELCRPDYRALSRAIARAMEDRRWAEEVARRAHERAKAFTYREMARRMARALEEAASFRSVLADAAKG